MVKIYLYSLKDKKSHELTDGWYSASNPVFSSDGKFVFFTSDRDFNPIYSRTEWNHAYQDMSRIYLVTLAKSTDSPFKPKSDEVEIKQEDKAKKKSDSEKTDPNDIEQKQKQAEQKKKEQQARIVVDIEGKPVMDTRDLIDTVSAMPPGTKVNLGVMRNGDYQKFTVELEERVREGEEVEPVSDDRSEDETSERVGISVANIDGRARQYHGIEEDMNGVVITKVKAVSPAGEENLMRGDVITEANGHEITAVNDLVAEVNQVDEGGYLRLYVHRPRADRSFFAILKLDQ